MPDAHPPSGATDRERAPRTRRAFRALVAFAVGSLAVCSAFVAATPAPAGAATPTVRVVSSLATVQPLDVVAGGSRADLTALRGEAESFQLVIGGGAAALQGVDTVLASPLRTAGGAELAASATTFSLEAYTRVWTPSDQEGLDPDPDLPARQRGWCQHFQSFAMPDPSTCGIPTSYSTDGTPFNNQWKCGGATAPVIDVRRCLFPDALIPRVDPYYGQARNAFPFSVPAGENRVVWVDVLVPPGATAGSYSGTVRVTATGMTAVDVPVTLVVKPVRLPASGEAPNLDLEAGVRAGTDVGPSFCQAQGCAGASLDANYRAQSVFVRSALENRLPLTNLPGRENPYVSHRPAFDKWITPYFTGAGPTTTVDGVLPARLPTARNRNVLLDHNLDQDGWRVWTEALRASGNQSALAFYCDEVLQSATLFANQCSDPYDAKGATGWASGGGTGALPSFLIGNQGQYDVAHARGRLVTTNAKTLVPNTMFHLHRRGTANTRPTYDTGFLAGAGGRRLWGYDSNNALGAGTDWTTSSAYSGYPALGGVDQPATSERAAGFVAWSYRLSGHFYYSAMHRFGQAWNDCSATPTACLYDEFGGHGDGTLYYPGPTSRVGGTEPIPIESMRLKRFRDGSEDYTVLRLLEVGCAGYGGCTARTRADLLAIVGGPEVAETTGAMSRTWRTSIGATRYTDARAALLALLPDPDPIPTELDDSGRIVFSSSRDGDLEIFTMGPDGGGVAQLTTAAAADQFPAWSPDGRRIAWTRGSDVWVMDANGANATNLTADVAGNASKPAWSPDGSTLVYVYGTAGAPTDLYKMSATGTAKTPLVTYATGGISSFDPSVSPSGVVFFSQDGGGGQQPGLFRINLTGGGGFARVTTGIDEVVDVSPDGSRLTFSRSSTGATPYDVYTAALDGSGLRNVTASVAGGGPVNDFQSSFSPDGSSLVLTSALGGDLELWVVDTTGTTGQALTTNTSVDADADWGPSARYAATVSLTPESLDTASTSAPLTASIEVPFRDLLAVEPSSVRITRIDGKDVSADPRFASTSWSVSGSVATATFDRSSLNQYLRAEGMLNRSVSMTVTGTSLDGTWSFEGVDTIRPK